MTVEIYGKDGCGNCDKAKEFFMHEASAVGIEVKYSKFAEAPLDRRRELVIKLKEFAKGVTYPIICFDNTLFVGFSEDFWREKLV